MSVEVRAGPWSFALPEGWQDASGDPEVPYFESTDGTWGCYVRVMEFAGADARSDLAALAARVQTFHEASLTAAPDASFAVQGRAAAASDETAESMVDYLDADRQYRIVSVVQVSPPLALHLTLHHYLCDDHAASQAYAGMVLASVRHVSGGDDE